MLVTGFPAGALAANCYLVASGPGSECLVVDPGQDCLPELRDRIERHRLTPSAVLLTHGHPDHTWLVTAVCAEFGVPAYLHPADRAMLTEPGAWLPTDLAAMLLAERSEWTAPALLRDAPYGQVLDLAGLSVTVAHTAGHTGGSVTYAVGEGPEPALLLSGDLLFAGSIGRTDLPGGDASAMRGSLAEHVLALPDGLTVLPGHGPATSIGRERDTNPFLVDLTRVVG